MDRLRKDVHKLFQGMKLDVTVETNLLITDYLDVTFNLNDGSYKPYKKPNDETLYINAKSPPKYNQAAADLSGKPTKKSIF